MSRSVHQPVFLDVPDFLVASGPVDAFSAATPTAWSYTNWPPRKLVMLIITPLSRLT